MQLSEKDIDRFWKKVRVCEHGRECRECHWFWKGHTRGIRKYGSFTVFYDGDEKRWQYYSHRVMWYVLTGEDSLPVYHTCPLSLCVQLGHLSQKDKVVSQLYAIKRNDPIMELLAQMQQ